MSAHTGGARGHGLMTMTFWSPPELELIAANTHLPDKAIAILLADKFSVLRSVGAVKTARLRRIGSRRTQGPGAQAIVKAKIAREYQKASCSGWPSLKGSPEERDAQHVRDVITAWLELQQERPAA